MLDFRLETFLTLCKLKSYTKTAEYLHITQPAVSQHIRYLEEHYKIKLFTYKKRSLTLTEEGEMLKSFAMTMQAGSNKIKLMLSDVNKIHPLTFGATLTIAEYTMPPILAKTLLDYPTIDLTMEVDNTQVLLEKLIDGKIDFALLEGHFDKSKYESKIFSIERFIPVCSPKNPLAYNVVNFTDFFNERLILREKGSGTREVFEQTLYEHNLTISNFRSVSKMGNMSVIKNLVKQNLGITFLYEEAVLEELANGELYEIQIPDFKVNREFNFVFLKNSVHEEEYLRWFRYFKTKKPVSV